MYDIQKIREDFPILSRTVYDKPLIYLDNGATTQKPRCVVDAMVDEYYSVNANVHRGVHFLSQQATNLHEASRETVRRFINARSTSEIVFTRGTTESINLGAFRYLKKCRKTTCRRCSTSFSMKTSWRWRSIHSISGRIVSCTV